jgi:hypothetical protein
MQPTDKIAIEHVSFVKTLILNTKAGGFQADHWTRENGWQMYVWPQSGCLEIIHEERGLKMIVGPSAWQSAFPQDSGESLSKTEPIASADPVGKPDHQPVPQKRISRADKIEAERRLAALRAGQETL